MIIIDAVSNQRSVLGKSAADIRLQRSGSMLWMRFMQA